MKMLGAQVIPVTSGNKTLKDATNEAIRDWVSNVEDTHYIIGSVVGPHPYPMIVRDFQAIIGNETKEQIQKKENRLPDYIIACVGGGSNAMGIFYPFLDLSTKLIGIEAAGHGLDTEDHCASITLGEDGIFQGMMTKLLQDNNGQVNEVYSISAGLDYPGIGPEHSFHKDNKSVSYDSITDQEALDAFVDKTQERVSGEVKLKLYKGSVTVAGRKSPYTRYKEALATYGEGDKFDQSLAKGFIDLWAMPYKK